MCKKPARFEREARRINRKRSEARWLTPAAFYAREGIKKPAASYSRTGESRTTLGDGALNFRVRNGNGCDNSSMATGKKGHSPGKRIATYRGAEPQALTPMKFDSYGRSKRYGQASRLISTGQLNRSRGLHPPPIEDVVYILP